jgi:hypothetical protein
MLPQELQQMPKIHALVKFDSEADWLKNPEEKFISTFTQPNVG